MSTFLLPIFHSLLWKQPCLCWLSSGLWQGTPENNMSIPQNGSPLPAPSSAHCGAFAFHTKRPLSSLVLGSCFNRDHAPAGSPVALGKPPRQTICTPPKFGRLPSVAPALIAGHLFAKPNGVLPPVFCTYSVPFWPTWHTLCRLCCPTQSRACHDVWPVGSWLHHALGSSCFDIESRHVSQRL